MRAAQQLLCISFFLASAVAARGEGLDPAIQAKIAEKLVDIRAIAADPMVVAAVKKHNESPSDAAKAMIQERWKALSMLDALVKELARNEAAGVLKTRRDEAVTEAFLSGDDGAKVALLSKTSNWNHKGKPKHDVPMAGKEWQGSVEVDESTGKQQVQVSVPVLDAQKPIGSLVVGLSYSLEPRFHPTGGFAPRGPLEAIELLSQMRGFGKHRFWGELSSVDVLSSLPLAGHQQLTDAFLVKTAERHRGILVTFDRGATFHDPSGRRVLVLDAQT